MWRSCLVVVAAFLVTAVRAPTVAHACPLPRYWMLHPPVLPPHPTVYLVFGGSLTRYEPPDPDDREVFPVRWKALGAPPEPWVLQTDLMGEARHLDVRSRGVVVPYTTTLIRLADFDVIAIHVEADAGPIQIDGIFADWFTVPPTADASGARVDLAVVDDVVVESWPPPIPIGPTLHQRTAVTVVAEPGEALSGTHDGLLIERDEPGVHLAFSGEHVAFRAIEAPRCAPHGVDAPTMFVPDHCLDDTGMLTVASYGFDGAVDRQLVRVRARRPAFDRTGAAAALVGAATLLVLWTRRRRFATVPA